MSKRYYYSASVAEFLNTSSNEILGQLTDNNDFELTLEGRNSWRDQIPLLQNNLAPLEGGTIYIEYTIPRMGKRCDVILVHSDAVFIIEFKVGANHYHPVDARQAIDYALDLKNFHEQSHDIKLIPILIATEASKTPNTLEFAADKVANCQFSNGQNLIEIIQSNTFQDSKITPHLWAKSTYQPTPTIIEAAKKLYENHSVEDISRNDATAINLSQTCDCIEAIIERSKSNSEKSICFVTGVPGAGKTLAGLNVATSLMDSENKEHSTFLSGNGPLVTVLQRALTLDKKEREGITINEAKREAETFIQNIHHFRDNYIIDKSAPSDKVVVFDEAQRAWTKEKASKFMKSKKSIPDFNQSEPQFLIEVMGRHEDWCVIIALIGGGQEINDGEAGLPEWFKAIKQSNTEWKTYFSPTISSPEYTFGNELSDILPRNSEERSSLHLSVSLRSFRAEQLSKYVNAIISGQSELAHKTSKLVLERYPIVFTRNIDTAKSWIKNKSRGTERTGILASAHAKRLVPYGIQMKLQIEPEHWFLAEEEDVRSSNFLELAASQYDVQGLELDWTIVGWDADLRRIDSQWEHFSFKGSKWMNINKPINQLYLRNAYRVILTRARQGMILFIPEGDESDKTRKPKFYESTVDYLKACGIPEITE